MIKCFAKVMFDVKIKQIKSHWKSKSICTRKAATCLRAATCVKQIAPFFTLSISSLQFSFFFFKKSVYEWNEIEIDYFAFFSRSIEIMIDPIDPITARALTSKCKCKGVRVNRVNFSSFRSIEFISSLLRFVSFLRKCACWIWPVKPILPTSSGYGELNARACRARKYNKLYISHANANHANASQSNE